MANKKKWIYLAVLEQGEIRAELAQALLSITHQYDYNVDVGFHCDKPISYNRNKIVQTFLQDKKYDYLLMLDGDNVPPATILHLADFDKDIICGLSFGWQKGLVIPSVFRRKKDGTYTIAPFNGDEGLIEVDAAGSGQMMIARRVLEKLRYPFRNEYDRDGIKKIGLDLNFCQRAKELGFKTWVHLNYISDHMVTFNLKDVYRVLIEKDEALKRLEQIKIHIDNNELKNGKKTCVGGTGNCSD